MSNSSLKTYVLLDNIRSVHNVGSIFRTAECAGVSRIYCVGTTPVPIDRFGRKRKDFIKVSLGAEDMVGWEHVDGEDVGGVIKQLKKAGVEIVAIEQGEKSVDIQEFKRKVAMCDCEDAVKIGGNMSGTVDKAKAVARKSDRGSKGVKGILYVFGNEVEGVSQKLLRLADVAVEIPMKGEKESLNVAVTVGVVLFCLARGA